MMTTATLFLLLVINTLAYVQAASFLSPSGAAAAAVFQAKKSNSVGQQKRDIYNEHGSQSSDEGELEDFIQLGLSPDELNQLKTWIAANTQKDEVAKMTQNKRLNHEDEDEDELSDQLLQLASPEKRRTSDHVVKQESRAAQPKATVKAKKRLGVKFFDGDDDDDTLDVGSNDASDDVDDKDGDDSEADSDDDDRRRRGSAAVGRQDRDYGNLFGGIGHIGKRHKSAQHQVQGRAMSNGRTSRFLEAIGLGSSNPYGTSYDNYKHWGDDDVKH